MRRMSASTQAVVQALFRARAFFRHGDEDRPHRGCAASDIIQEDEVGGPIYTLFEGWAIRYHRLPKGARQILDIVLPGDMIGLASAILGTVKHSVQAITPATLCVLSGRGIPELFDQHPGLALNVMQTQSRGGAAGRCTAVPAGAQQCRAAHRLSDARNLRPVRQRGMVDGGSTCPFPLQRRDIADAVGLSRVHVARTLERLRDGKLAEIQDGSWCCSTGRGSPISPATSRCGSRPAARAIL